MYFVMHYCLAYNHCDILVLRRTFKELESGAIADFKAFVPAELYTYDSTKHVATFINGSRVVFGHCQNNKERDIEQYLGQAYPAILIDEAGQFSPDAWMMLYSRNTINASCEPDANGNMPIPCIWGCTNPLGPFYEFYRTVFVEKEPWNKPEDARKDETNGTWWVQEAGEWRLIHDPANYACQRSTVMDNPEILKRDPGIIQPSEQPSKSEARQDAARSRWQVRRSILRLLGQRVSHDQPPRGPRGNYLAGLATRMGRARLGHGPRQCNVLVHSRSGESIDRHRLQIEDRVLSGDRNNRW
jgi:hypothetical protein